MSQSLSTTTEQRTAQQIIQESDKTVSLQDQIIVVKYGGNAMTEPALKRGFAQNIALLQQAGLRPVVVHGGGPQINSALDRVGKQGQFIQGMRVTDAETLQVVQWVLLGEVQQEIVLGVNQAGGTAVGLSGKDGQLLFAKRHQIPDPEHPGNTLDIGHVGEIYQVNLKILNDLLGLGYVPVISPIAYDPQDGTSYNVNADVAAAKVAEALSARHLLLMTNIAGVLDKSGALLAELDAAEIDAFKRDGTISGGMIPKIDSALSAAQQGVGAVHILDGRVPDSLVRELLTEQHLGTVITA